jgi:capsular polysaccharide export protein
MSFLRIPPFPGHRAGALVVPGETRDEPEDVIAALRREQVGGAFWAPPGDWKGRIVLAPTDRDEGDALMNEARAQGVAERCVIAPRGANPWAIAQQADEVRAGAGHDLALVAALAGRGCARSGGAHGRGWSGESALVGAVRRGLTGVGRDPFDGRALSLVEVVALLGAWLRGIEANQDFDAVHGVARWKRVTMAPMLWDGGGAVPFGRRGARVLGWRARIGDGPLWGEVEDGFIRSVGLGARCVPPLSVVVDRAPHIDPTRESGLERILSGPIDEDLIVRAASLRGRLVAGGSVNMARGWWGSGAIRVARSWFAGRWRMIAPCCWAGRG